MDAAGAVAGSGVHGSPRAWPVAAEQSSWTVEILGFALGVAGFHLLSQPLPWSWLLAAALGWAGVALAWTVWRRRDPGAFGALMKPLPGVLSCLLAGVAWAQVHACMTLCRPFPATYTSTELVIEGRIASLPTAGPTPRFLFRVESARSGETDIGFAGLVRLSWYRDAPPLSVGERWRLTARLRPPHGLANPGSFDVERWLFDQGVTATGSIRPGEGNIRLHPGPGAYWLDRLRERLRDHIAQRLSGSAALGLVQALSLGERSAIPPAQWEVLTRTGTNHLVAISGLHVGLVAGFVFLVVRTVWAWGGRLPLVLAAPRAAALAAFIAALGYSALAGFAVSTQRSLVMLAVVLGALYWGRTPRPVSVLVLALGLVLLIDPQAVLSYGFWLSFGAVAALLYGLGSRPLVSADRGSGPRGQGAWSAACSRAWARWAAPQWAVALGLFPALLLLFGRASLIAPAVNLVAIPLFALLLPALLLSLMLSLVPSVIPLAIPAMGLPLVWIGQVLDGCLQALSVAADLPWAAVAISARPAWVWASAFAGVLLLLAPRGLPGRSLGWLALLPLGVVRAQMPAPGEAWFTLLDVGQGLSAVVRTHGHVLVYDTGPGFGGGFDSGSAVILPFLRWAGVGRVDTLVLSHADQDHVGGYPGLRRGLPIDTVLSGEPAAIPEASAVRCEAGQVWDWDGVRFGVLHPPPERKITNPPKPGARPGGNDSSCVLRVDAGGVSVLLTGDIGRTAELALVAAQRPALNADVLVAAHHGSARSSSRAFLEAVAPRFVLYATGFADRFGFPSRQTRERVAALGAMELDTADLGAISFRLTPGLGLQGPSWYRAEHLRLWTHRPAPGAVPVPSPQAFEYD